MNKYTYLRPWIVTPMSVAGDVDQALDRGFGFGAPSGEERLGGALAGFEEAAELREVDRFVAAVAGEAADALQAGRREVEQLAREREDGASAELGLQGSAAARRGVAPGAPRS